VKDLEDAAMVGREVELAEKLVAVDIPKAHLAISRTTQELHRREIILNG